MTTASIPVLRMISEESEEFSSGLQDFVYRIQSDSGDLTTFLFSPEEMDQLPSFPGKILC
jgi:hypothetical protein